MYGLLTTARVVAGGGATVDYTVRLFLNVTALTCPSLDSNARARRPSHDVAAS